MDEILKNISRQLTKIEFKELKFLSIEILATNEFIYKNDIYMFLKRIYKRCESIHEIGILLKHIQRFDLISQINLESDSYVTQIRPYRLLLFNISKKLNSKDIKELLFILNIPPQDQDRINESLDLILYLEKKFIKPKELLNNLLECFKTIKRLDIQSEISEFLLKNKNLEEDNLSIQSSDLDSLNEHYDIYPGLCLIFNFETFLGLKKRTGTNIDRDGLKKLYQEHVQFTTECFDNLDYKQFLEKLDEFSKIGLEYNCLILYILSHGTKATIYTSDNIIVSIKKIFEYFSHGNCSFKNKPKIFFICACQKDPNDEDPIDESDLIFEEDFFVCLASKFGQEAMRIKEKGTLFIQSHIEAFHSGAESLSIFDLQTCTQNGVKKRSENHKISQTPIVVSTLSKLIRFKFKN